MHRRTYLTALLSGTTIISGCSEVNKSTATTPIENLVKSGNREYPHKIYVDNTNNYSVDVTISVTRGELEIYMGEHTVPAQTQEIVAGITKNTLSKDKKQINVSLEDENGKSASVSMFISDCLGDITFFYESDGTLRSTYSIC